MRQEQLIDRVRKIDFYFLNLNRLRNSCWKTCASFWPSPRPSSEVQHELVDAYEEVVGRYEIERLRRLGSRLAGKRIVHVNSTRQGGGVAEILGWMIPLMVELGIDTRWEVLPGHARFLSRHEGLPQRHARVARQFASGRLPAAHRYQRS